MADKIAIRKALKSKKPSFRKQDSHKKLKLSRAWRKPRGLQSKVRLKKRGYVMSVSKGWKSPRDVRGLTPEGQIKRKVYRVAELEGIDAKKEAVEIASSVGTKKRIMIIEEALKKGAEILNVKDPKKFLDDINAEIKKKRESRDKKQKEREKKQEKKVAEAKKKEKKEEKDVSAEEKQKEEKKEKDKVLTQAR
ncbi:MAG: eL32 family ribosomal protein [Candidatus Nanoarchaeia archaeon]